MEPLDCRVNTDERDGLTPVTAIREDWNVWRQRHCPGYLVLLRALQSADGKYVDKLIVASDTWEDVRVVYFELPYHFGS